MASSEGEGARNGGTTYGSIGGKNPETNPLLSEDKEVKSGSGYYESPEYFKNASWWSKLVFAWMEPLLDLGNSKEQIDPQDLDTLPLLTDDRTTSVSSVFYNQWDAEKRRVAKIAEENAKRGSTKDDPMPSLPRALFLGFGYDFLRAGLLKAIHDLLQFVGPQVLNGLILFLRDENAPLSDGLILTAVVVLAQLTMSFCLRHYFFECYRTGLKLRTAVVMAIYQKSLLLSSAERQSRSAGQITNLMSVDAQRLQDTCTYLHAIWYSFLQIGLSIYFLWRQLGPSCLAGVAVIIVTIPLTGFVAKLMQGLQRNLMKAKDERVDVNNEVLGSMKVIKLQAWEQSFQDRIMDLRKTELKQLLHYIFGRAATFMLWQSVPLLVALATFAAYVLSGNDLDVASALTALALFDILRFPLFMLPQVINNIVEALVAIGRIQSFLLGEEHDAITEGDLSGTGINIDNSTFVYDSKRPKPETPPPTKGKKIDNKIERELDNTKWEVQLLRSQLADAEQKIKSLVKTNYDSVGNSDTESANVSDNLLSLKRADFQCKEGELIAVVGAVGSGKSTLINSIIGEVRPISGSVSVKGKIAYYAQTPFIMNDTLKGNILFGNDPERINLSKYKTAIDTCALSHDLEILPKGELCEIGEKGITLSGGQKARVAMARAVYHDADIYLLDDPLAAVDAHVGKHIFEKCIVDELLKGHGGVWSTRDMEKRKTSVILVTNALQYLSNPAVDKIIVLKNGCIEEVGTYAELTTDPQYTVFKALLESFNKSLDDGSDAKDDVENIAEGEAIVEVDTEGEATDEPKEEEEDDDGEGDETLEELQEASNISARKVSFTDPFPGTKLTRRQSAPPPRTLKLLAPSAANNMHRSMSHGLSAKKNSEKDESPGLATDEYKEREVGEVSFAMYMAWAKAAGGLWIGILIILAFLLVQGITVLSQWWLTYWSAHGKEGDRSQMWFLAIYGLINLGAIVGTFCRMLFGSLCGLRAARTLFAEMLDVILRAPMSFFDTTPLGRIINRFSKDIYTIDEVLTATFQMYLTTLIAVVGVIVVISTVTPLFALCLIPILFFYNAQQRYFTKTYRELKRLDSVSRSPIYALFSETLDGVASIRAFGAQGYLSNRMELMVDEQQRAYFLTCTAQCWLAVRLELAGTLIVCFACLCSVLQHGSRGGDETFAGLAGLSISFALSVTQALNWSVRMASDLEANMVSVERIEQYCKIESEAPRTADADLALGTSWPSEGVIEFRNSKLRYRPGLPLVLKGLDLVIPSHSKVGVVGRTGAGKSTLMVALLRIVELCEGSVFIDGVDISTLGLQKLRSQIAVIPQDPVLFSGSVRTNLDPFNNFKDTVLIEALQRVGLMSNNEENSKATSLTRAPIDSLTQSVLEGGSNFSVGQRQLLVFARALLCGSSIVIMDEATAAVDPETDAKIQHVVRTEFKDATCITVAHRLNTIMDSDYILVMDDGRAAEFDPPSVLLARGGLFKDLVDTYEREARKGM